MPDTFENLPKGHKEQVADEFCRVAVEYVPATHSLQLLRLNMPGRLDHEPAGHDKQYEIFGAATPGEYEPAGQSTQSDGNVNGNFRGLEYLPDAQLRHVVMDVAREALEKVPAEQFRQNERKAAPGESDHVPMGQFSHKPSLSPPVPS